MSPADRLTMLEALGLKIELVADGTRLDVSGPAILVDAASATLRQHRRALIAYLAAREGEAGDAPAAARDSAVPLRRPGHSLPVLDSVLGRPNWSGRDSRRFARPVIRTTPGGR